MFKYFKKLKKEFYKRISINRQYESLISDLKKRPKSARKNTYFLPKSKIPRKKPITENDFFSLMKDIENLFIIKRDYKKNSLCTAESTRMKFFNDLLFFLNENHFELYFRTKAGLQRLSNIKTFFEAVGAKKTFDIRVNDYRSDAVFHFVVEVWEDEGDIYKAPCKNQISMKVRKRTFIEHKILKAGKTSFLADIIQDKEQDKCNFDVDVVYTWVNSEDEDWIKMFKQHAPDALTDASSKARFYNRDELKFSLRSINEYMSWVRNVYIVSNCAPPDWIDLKNSKLKWIAHEKLFNKKSLPVFSSHAIETKLHKIKGLSNYFIYFNDDVMLSRTTFKQDFYFSNGIVKLALEPYGNVSGDLKEGEPDYLNAARNVQALIDKDFDVIPTQLHTHSPLVLRKDILKEIEENYKSEITETAKQKFRKITDISLPSFFFPHYAYSTGKAIKSERKTLLIQQNHNFLKRFKELKSEKKQADLRKRHLSFCLNDGGNSHENHKWNTETISFLKEYFPQKSEFEN
jgi:hypothetical protein